MPCFELRTNVPRSKITEEFLKETSKVLASTLGKPECYVAVNVHPDQLIVWGGTSDPAGHSSLLSIGSLGVQENKKHSKVISEHINKYLGIPKDRLYIQFIDAPPSTIGYDGSTFA